VLLGWRSSEIRKHNPLLVGLVFKRNLSVNGKRLAAGGFETQPLICALRPMRIDFPPPSLVAGLFFPFGLT
jgi:hypothetical protein